MLLSGEIRLLIYVLYADLQSCFVCFCSSLYFLCSLEVVVGGLFLLGMVFIYSTSLYNIYIAHHYNITQDAEREMHEVQYLYVAFP